MNRDADRVFIGPGFWLDGKGDGGLGKLRRRVIDRRSSVAQSFAGSGFLQFGDGADVSGVKLADFRELLTLNDLDMLEAFGKVAIVIGERGVIFQDAALHFEVVDTSRERIGQRFEDKEGERLAIVILALDAVALAAGLLEADLGVLIGMGKCVGEEGK